MKRLLGKHTQQCVIAALLSHNFNAFKMRKKFVLKLFPFTKLLKKLYTFFHIIISLCVRRKGASADGRGWIREMNRRRKRNNNSIIFLFQSDEH